MTLRIALAAHLCGVGMGMATIISLVPAVVKLLRMMIE
jgi:hypothetical protein